MLSSKQGVELKGGMYTFMSLKLHTYDTQIIDQQLADKVQQAPAFFKDTPVVIDLSILEQQDDADIDTNALLDCVKRHELVPIVVSIGDKSSPLVRSIKVPLIESGSRRQDASAKAQESASPTESDGKSESKSSGKPSLHESTKSDAPKSATNSSTDNTTDSASEMDLDLAMPREIEYVIKAPQLITKPVRSGQQIYAKDTDLIIMSSVGPGAEVIADNNIHIYGPLRGRALCGVSGNQKTRIFCQSLEAELVSVAGHFKSLETIPEELRGKPAQIWLDNDRLNIEPL